MNRSDRSKLIHAITACRTTGGLQRVRADGHEWLCDEYTAYGIGLDRVRFNDLLDAQMRDVVVNREALAKAVATLSEDTF